MVENLRARSETDVKESIDDPQIFFTRFRNSTLVKTHINHRFQTALAKNPTITIEEMQEAYWNTEAAIADLWQFWQDYPLTINPTKLTPDFWDKLNSYFNQIKTIVEKRATGTIDQETIKADDIQRSQKHTIAASQLVAENITPNITFGRVLVHFLAIAENLDNPDPDRIKKRRQAMGY